MKTTKTGRSLGVLKTLALSLWLAGLALVQAQGDPSVNPQEVFRAAITDLKAMHWDRARIGFKKILKDDPQNLKAHFCLGEIEYYTHHLASAEGYFRWVNFHDPDMPANHYYLGRAAYDQKHYAEALSEMENACRLDDQISMVHYYLGLIHYRQNDLTGSQKELEKAVALDPSSSKAHYALAYLLYHDFHEHSSAMSEANAALKGDSDTSLRLKTFKLIQLIKSGKRS